MPRPKRNETRKKALFEREHGCRIPLATAAEVLEIDELTRLGVVNGASSDDPSDYRWDGGKNKIDADAIIATGFRARSLSDDLHLAIIEKRTKDRKRKPDQARKKSELEFHLEQVNKHLFGQPARRGAPKPDYEPILARVAVHFHAVYFGFEGCEVSLDELLWDKIRPRDSEYVDPQTKNNLLKPYRREWKAHRDRLLLKVTEEGSALANERPMIIAKVLARLGIV